MTRLRDDAVGEPGAHAHGAAARKRKPRPRRSSANGGSTSPSSARPPTTCASASSTRARKSPTCRSRTSATRRRNTTGPWVAADDRRAARSRRHSAGRRRRRAAASCSARPTLSLAPLGLGAVRHADPGQLAAAARAAMPASCASRATPTKALAFSSDVTPRYCEADPFEGGKQAVAECWRNLTATGAEPLAATDNLNFGNPERPEIMGQLVAGHQGHRRGLPGARLPDRLRQRLALQRDQRPGHPADPDHRRRRPDPRLDARWRASALPREGEAILLVGAPTGWGTHLGQSIYLRDIHGRTRWPAAAGRSGAREAGRRFRPQPDPRRPRHRRARSAPTAAWRWRSPKWRWRRASAPPSTSSTTSTRSRSSSARTRAATS